MPELALEVGPHRGPLVRVRPDELLQVVPRAEVLALAPEDDDAHVVVGISGVERGIERVDECGVLRVGHVRPVHRDPRDRPFDLVPHDLLGHGVDSTRARSSG